MSRVCARATSDVQFQSNGECNAEQMRQIANLLFNETQPSCLRQVKLKTKKPRNAPEDSQTKTEPSLWQEIVYADDADGVEDLESYYEPGVGVCDVEACSVDNENDSDAVHAREILPGIGNTGPWLKNHDLALLYCVRKFGPHWTLIQRKLRSNRTSDSLRYRYKKLCLECKSDSPSHGYDSLIEELPHVKAGQPRPPLWTPQEDAALVAHVEQSGPCSPAWYSIAHSMKTTRSPDSLCRRYKAILKRRLTKSPLLDSNSSDLILLCKEAHEALGLVMPLSQHQHEPRRDEAGEMPRDGLEVASSAASRKEASIASTARSEPDEEMDALKRIRNVAAQIANT